MTPYDQLYAQVLGKFALDEDLRGQAQTIRKELEERVEEVLVDKTIEGLG